MWLIRAGQTFHWCRVTPKHNFTPPFYVKLIQPEQGFPWYQVSLTCTPKECGVSSLYRIYHFSLHFSFTFFSFLMSIFEIIDCGDVVRRFSILFPSYLTKRVSRPKPLCFWLLWLNSCCLLFIEHYFLYMAAVTRSLQVCMHKCFFRDTLTLFTLWWSVQPYYGFALKPCLFGLTLKKTASRGVGNTERLSVLWCLMWTLSEALDLYLLDLMMGSGDNFIYC